MQLCGPSPPRYRILAFFPVAAAPAVPAPAPAAAPIAAPLPPPASAPIIAPPAAPPPMNPASRLPLPPSVLPAELVASEYVFPPTVTVCSRKYSFAGVDKRPEACTLLTVSLTGEPLGIITLPSAVTSCATDPVTVSHALAVFELTDWSVTTVIFAPTGTVPSAFTIAGNSNANARKVETNRIRDFISVTSVLDWACRKSLAERTVRADREHRKAIRSETSVPRNLKILVRHTNYRSAVSCR